ncbi:MAG: KH domain-containing protein [archaeon]
MQEESIRIPGERIAVLIGSNGEVRKEIEKRTKTKIRVDSESGEIVVSAKTAGISALRAVDIVSAIGRGFSPENALQLLDENNFLEIIDVTDYAGKSRRALEQKKGRVIGTKGKTRREIAEITGTEISVYGKTIAIIGPIEGMGMAKRAIEMLLEGANHSTVQAFLQRSVSIKRQIL